MLTDIANEVEEGHVLKPIVVVDHFGSGFAAIEIEESLQLFAYTRHIMVEGGCIKQIAFLAFARRIAYHASGTTNKRIRFVASALKMHECHDLNQMTDM